jgi:hypothetical protein
LREGEAAILRSACFHSCAVVTFGRRVIHAATRGRIGEENQNKEIQKILETSIQEAIFLNLIFFSNREESKGSLGGNPTLTESAPVMSLHLLFLSTFTLFFFLTQFYAICAWPYC